ncbi:unnamed protein product [Orchesella dallaii]|uniref:Prominin-like protein n=1 Tax=Orchesella dallaii TaxID=48710 RepID=A0ABP1QKV1_9HEXA
METDVSDGMMASGEGSAETSSMMGNTLTQPAIDFLLPNMSDNPWRSSYEFNAAGMQVVYLISNLTLHAIFPTYDQYLEYGINYRNYTDLLDISRVDWEDLVWKNKGPLGVFLGGIVFIVILSLWGIGWCFAKCCCGDDGCCKGCCGKGDAAEDLMAAKLERKRDKCKRTGCGILFATLVVVFMFGLVCCFVTNEQMRISVERMPEDVDNSLADLDIYLNTTERQINALFKDNYDLLSVTLNHILDQSGEIIKNGLSRKTGAQALNNLTDIVDTVEEVQNNVRNVERVSKSLKDKADQLQAGLTDSKNRLIFLLEQCETERCVDLKNLPEIRSLRVQNDFQNLPNMTDVLRELGQLLGTDVRRSIEDGKRAFNQLGIRIKNEVEPVLPEIKATIDDTGKELANVAKTLSHSISLVPVDEYRDDVRDSEVYIKKYAPYRYYAVLGVCITLAFIFTLLTLGIFIGFCGRQPGSEYSNECCSRKTGSSFLNCGIFFMFLTGGILMVVALAHFVAAGGLTQVVCEAINDADNRTEDVFRLPRLVNREHNYIAPPFTDIIRECQHGASAYTALRLSTVYDIDNITALADRFKHKARHLANQVTLPDEATEGIVFLTPEAKQQLMRFSRSKINKVKFDDFASQLEDSIVSVDLRELIGRFNITIEDPETSRMSNEVRSRLQNEVLILESLQDKLLTPMLADVRNAVDSLRFLFKQQKQLAAKVEGVAEAAERAQQSLHNSGATQQVRELANEFESEFVRHVEDYANFTYKSIRDNVGQCQPLYNSFNATTTTFCHKIGSPLGAFWFSLSGLLVLFIPLIIVAISLARLYRKFRYAGYESETYYSAYGDGDTIPLSMNANGGARRHKRTREPSHSGGSRFPSRFEDTSQNPDEMRLPFNLGQQPRSSTSSNSQSTSVAVPSRSTRTNLRFVDTDLPHDLANREVKYRGVGLGDSSMSDDDAESTPPPPYSAVVQSKAVETVPLTSAPPDSSSLGDGSSNTEGADHLYEYEYGYF